MNPWYEMFITVIILGVMGIIFLSCIILRFKSKDKKRLYRILALTSALVITGFIIFLASHKTTFKYNDWKIVDANIHIIQDEYGEFDIGEVREGECGCVGYYIYTDNGPIMPDHLKHYYYMRYDEWGVVYEVYESGQPGG